MGESFDGMAIFGRLFAGNTPELYIEGRRHSLCSKARIRVLCAGAQREKVRSQSLCEQFSA